MIIEHFSRGTPAEGLSGTTVEGSRYVPNEFTVLVGARPGSSEATTVPAASDVDDLKTDELLGRIYGRANAGHSSRDISADRLLLQEYGTACQSYGS